MPGSTGGIVDENDPRACATGIPMTYLHVGRERVVVAVGGPDHPAELVALALPGG